MNITMKTSSTLNTLSTSQRFDDMLARYFMSWPCAARAHHQVATRIVEPSHKIQPRECKLLGRKLDPQAEHDVSMQMRADTAHEHTRQAEPPLLTRALLYSNSLDYDNHQHSLAALTLRQTSTPPTCASCTLPRASWTLSSMRIASSP
jgi:hypothetical protein